MCPPARTRRMLTQKDWIGHQSMIERPREHTRVLPYNVKENAVQTKSLPQHLFWGRWHFTCEMTEGAALPIARIFLNIRRGRVFEIPLSGEMSRSDKRVAVRLRMPPPHSTICLFTQKNLIGHQILIERPREHTQVLPYNIKEKYAIIP